ncbi:hypothetical protein sscle_07g060810 [Sclerotinia sclerotiorum 1980 UF-70]|uniref:Rhodopsin domain-containing protein n=1 Tax=Sclerotinia sclerotiorum (strain ATCC 18683 / 1980 / Ss-1) TaxID=665079 RepID=A0A1D9Q8Q2_SCLS1|nr:hypothetical protein sscle_07g060810 [Sclerotinia sclerotiorum 1980 UF-70]
MSVPVGVDPWEIPLFPPPPGVISNFVNPPSRATLVISICSIALGLMWLIFLLRIYSKTFISHSLGWDDVVGTVAALGTTVYASNTIWEMNFLGPHGWNIRALSIPAQFGKNSAIISEVLYGVVMWFCKLSIFILYLRVFGPFGVNRVMRYLVYFGIVLSFIVYAATSVVFAVACTPRGSQTWLEALTTKRCSTGSYAPGYIQGSFGVFFDIYLFILPIWPVWNLQMKRRKKIAVTFIFATGLLAIAASIIGLYFRVLINQPKVDESWENPINQILANVEMSVTVICGSMPYLTSLFRRLNGGGSKLVASIQHILSRSYPFNRSHGSSNRRHEFISDEPFPDSMELSHNPHLETKILGTMNGEGRFLKTVDYPQQQMDAASSKDLLRKESSKSNATSDTLR